MHLKKIQLAGFKSFVDPTTILLQSNLTAVVGPNGCGKSNVVDALRWVIGESSAKQLRGELLTDVIFNGTTQRKPVGQASVELLFDNADGRIGGAYAEYNEIAIRRELNREGNSQFYLNGTRCRRRDITDLFLGTGLGPHSYGIIEQGMVSKLIDSKPEDLRIYLEETAGISKYRERRRETENRIHSTRENLDRLNDVRQEITKQLEHLKRQANAAERYNVLKQEQRQLKAQLHALHCQAIDLYLSDQQQLIADQQRALDEKNAATQHAADTITQHREHQTQLNEALSAIQGRSYALSAEIARVEQQIQHIQAQERQLTADLAQITTLWEEAEENLKSDQDQITQVSAELAALEPQHALAAQNVDTAQALLQATEQRRAEWQTEWEQFQSQATQAEQTVQLELTRFQHLHQKVQSTEQRIERLQQQSQQLGTGTLPEEIAQLSTQSDALKQALDLLQQTMNDLNLQAQTQRTANQTLQQKRDETRQTFHQLSSRQASLSALQQAALGKANASSNAWLQQQSWQEKPRVLEGLQVEAGWETAVETVLAPYLEAVCTDSAGDLALAAREFKGGRLAVWHTASTPSSTQPNPSYTLLAEKVTSRFPVADLLAGIYIAEDPQHALSMTAHLAAHESVVTREGTWFGPSWVRISQIQDETAGVIQRQQALQELDATLSQQQSLVQEAEQQLLAGQKDLTQLEETRDQKQREFREQSAGFNTCHSKLSAKQAEFNQLHQQEAALQLELQEQREQLQQAILQRDSALAHKTQAEAECRAYAEQRAPFVQQRDALNTEQQQQQQALQTAKQVLDQQHVRKASLQSQLHYSQQNIERATKQLAQLDERRAALLTRQTEAQSPLTELQTALQHAMDERATAEHELNATRAQVTQSEQQLHQLEQERAQAENAKQQIRDQLETARIEQSATAARREHHLEQIAETEFALAPLLADMPEEANTTDWQHRLEQIDSRIHRLGAINLAAIDEYNTLSERSLYLDNQNNDLCDALQTLEEAIRKIDRESRARLRETFEQANEHFKQLFHKMFEGGHAELELTGDEVLQAGVLIRAQPPGKRNTLLHLLSGGEKALTAIALVFALFQLNPAPFCVLDEVDAPLDEANVGRFCRLVKTMSETVQFIFISHNKVTMEMAQQLVGVTMHEPGVSRLVSVDMREALALAEVAEAVTS